MKKAVVLLSLVLALLPQVARAISQPQDPCLSGQAEGQTRTDPNPPDSNTVVKDICLCSAWQAYQWQSQGVLCDGTGVAQTHNINFEKYITDTNLPPPYGGQCTVYKTQEIFSTINSNVVFFDPSCKPYQGTSQCYTLTSTHNIFYNNSLQLNESAPFVSMSSCTNYTSDDNQVLNPQMCKDGIKIRGYNLGDNSSTGPGNC